MGGEGLYNFLITISGPPKNIKVSLLSIEISKFANKLLMGTRDRKGKKIVSFFPRTEDFY